MLKRKKKIELIGTLLLPLVIGHAAFIQCGNDTRWTSVVRHFIEQPSGVIHIETENTRYVLIPPAQATAKV